MVQHAVDRGHKVVGVCRERSVGKLEAFKGRITVVPGAADDRAVIQQAVAGCDGVLTVLVPWGAQHYATGTAQAVLDYARPGARLIFSCGWHIIRDGQDVYSRTLKMEEKFARWFGRLTHFIAIDDQVEACRRVFASSTRWTVVRGSGLKDTESWSSAGMIRSNPVPCSILMSGVFLGSTKCLSRAAYGGCGGMRPGFCSIWQARYS